jgi:hypothetical protein
MCELSDEELIKNLEELLRARREKVHNNGPARWMATEWRHAREQRKETER